MLLQQKIYPSHRVTPHKQSGAALLALMLVIIAGASYMLVSNLNANTRFYNRQIETASVLREAKAALLAYSVSYPEKYASSGPGVMPCPDLNNNGSASGNCSYTGATTLGRFPWKTVGVGEFKDHHGEHIWYVVSDNFRTPLVTQINSETPGTLKVDSNDDIVAVLIAPGAPLTGQNRASGPLLAINYLEGGNQVNDNNFVTRSAGEFNDQLVFITRKELMQVVEQRVINQARTIVNNYYDTYGDYPWLAPFADPKAGARWLKGNVSSTGSNLTDTSVDFSKWGVTAGDVVWNVTDGSHAVVSAVAANTLTLSGSGLGYGTNNTFSNNDEYYVEVRNLAARFRGTASSGSTGLVLRDTSRDFDELLVSTGDIVDNITDGSSGLVISALNDRITVASLAGGSTNSFSAGDSYLIRSNAGIAGTGSAGIVLADANVDFQLMNVQKDDLVRNVSLGTTGQVDIVNQHSLTVVGTTFNVGDHYSLSRFTGRTGTTQGLLPIHEPGSIYNSGFNVDWSFPTANGNMVTRSPSGGNSVYNTGLENWTQTSTGRVGTVTIASADSNCNWVAEKIVDCRGTLEDAEFLSGIITGATAATTLTDADKNFPEAGIKRGDKVQNTSNNSWGIVSATATGANLNRLTIANIFGWTALNKNNGQPYRVHIATSFTDGTATAPTVDNVWRLYDNTGKLAAASVGDIIENTRWNAIGIVTNVAFHATNGWYVDFTRLQGGTYTDYVSGETYRIHHNYVDRREYTFNLRLSGDIASTYSGGVRIRTICRGYGSNCTVPAETIFRGNGLTELVTVNDYRLDGTLLGSARLTVPAAGSPQSSVRISGLDYQLSETEFPDWFLSNRWHQLLYMAYSSELGPGGSGSCTPGGNCLQMLQGNTSLDDRGALILAAGMQLDNVLCPDASVQNRINARLCDYFENENAISNNILRKEHLSTLFNDRLISLLPATY